MGKIANALGKYAQERKTTRLPALTRADLGVLFSYNRKTGRLLDHEAVSGRVADPSMEALRNRGTIQRLLDHKLILPDGKLTAKGLAECERLKKLNQVQKPAVDADEKTEEQQNRGGQQKAQSALVRRGGFHLLRRLRALADEQGAAHQHQTQEGHADETGRDEGGPPARHLRDRQHRQRRAGTAEESGECMDREGAAQVGVEGDVAEPQRAHDRQGPVHPGEPRVGLPFPRHDHMEEPPVQQDDPDQEGQKPQERRGLPGEAGLAGEPRGEVGAERLHLSNVNT